FELMTAPARNLESMASAPLGRARPSAGARSPLLPGAALALTVLAAAPAQASNEGWPTAIIPQVRHQAVTEDAGPRPPRRRSAVERLDDFMIEEETVRPRRHARRHDRSEDHLHHRRKGAHRTGGNRLASLGRGAPPAAAAPVLAPPAAAALPPPAAA